MIQIQDLTRCDDCGRWTNHPRHPCIDQRGGQPRVVPPKSYVLSFVGEMRPRRKKPSGNA